jgi:hypothetical protein
MSDEHDRAMREWAERTSPEARVRSECDVPAGAKQVILTGTLTICTRCRSPFAVQFRYENGIIRNQPQCGPCRGKR